MATVRPADNDDHPDDLRLASSDPAVWLTPEMLARLSEEDAQAAAQAYRTAAIEAYARRHDLPLNELFRELSAERRHITDRAQCLRIIDRPPGWISPQCERKKARMLRAQNGSAS